MRDFQRLKVYEFSWALQDSKQNRKLTQAECKAVIEDSCALYNVPCPRVSFLSNMVCARGGKGEQGLFIKLPPHWAMNLETVLHEVAHVICYHYRTFLDHHGSNFMRVFIDLCEHFDFGGRITLTSLAQAKGIKIATLSDGLKMREVRKLKNFTQS